jgi:hypothetical protein
MALEQHLGVYLGQASGALLKSPPRRLHEPPLVALGIEDALSPHAVRLVLRKLGVDTGRFDAPSWT